MKTYRLDACENMISIYVNDFHGLCTVLTEGVLGLGTVLLYGGMGKKIILIQEKFLSEWSSTHTIRMYNTMPKKYQKIINNL